MSFTDVKSLNEHLATKAYVSGFEPSQEDVKAYQAFSKDLPEWAAPSFTEYPHAARWYAHIKSYAAEHSSLPASAEASSSKAAPAAKAAAEEEDDDDVDLFGDDDDEEDAEAERVKQERIAAYTAKKQEKAAANAAAGKDAPVAKSVVTLQVKPWDDETDMAALEQSVRSIEKDGLVWGASKLVPVGYGVRMLQINLVIEDEKISLDELQEEIGEFEDYVQSSDVAAMQKL